MTDAIQPNFFRGSARVTPSSVVRGRKNPLHYGLPSRLKQTRQEAGLTRMALAQMVGGSHATVGYLETKQRKPTCSTVARLAAALKVTAAYLAYGLGEQTSEDTQANTDGMGTRLASIRVECGLTKAELSRRVKLSPSAVADAEKRLVKLSPSTIGDIENGAQSGVEVIEALAEALGVSPAWLAFGDGPQILPPTRRGRPPQLTSGSA